jgi:hypothetical protein
VAEKVSSDANKRVGGTIFKKSDRSGHSAGRRKDCAARDRGEPKGACQHTCEPGDVAACRHAWTVRYSVGGRQREESFTDELYTGTKRVKPDSGLRKAQDFQLKWTGSQEGAGTDVHRSQGG